MKNPRPLVRLLQISLLIAISAVGAYVKLPSPTGTVALDSFAGYFTAATLGIPGGMTVGAAGHLLSAWTVGFPLGGVVHVWIAVQMAVYAGLFGLTFRLSWPLAAVLATVLNGVLGPVTMGPIIGWTAVPGLVLALLPGSAVNIGLATVIALRWREWRKI